MMLHKSETLLDLMELWTIGRESPIRPGEAAESLDFLRVIMNGGIAADQSEYINGERLSGLILLECGNMKPIINNPLVFQTTAINWLQSRHEQFKHLLEALFTDYLPYEEYREHETTILDGKIKTDDTRTIDSMNTINNDGSYTNMGRSHETDTTSVSADNESTFQPREQIVKDLDTDRLENRHKDETTDELHKGDTLDGTKKTDDTTNRELYGHKKSNQLLALEELEVAQNNLYDMIVKWWTDALFIAIYD